MLNSLQELSMAKNKIERVEQDALLHLNALQMLDLRENMLKGKFDSVPKSEGLD